MLLGFITFFLFGCAGGTALLGLPEIFVGVAGGTALLGLPEIFVGGADGTGLLGLQAIVVDEASGLAIAVLAAVAKFAPIITKNIVITIAFRFRFAPSLLSLKN